MKPSDPLPRPGRVLLAGQVTGIDATTLAITSRFDLADSALHAPAAGFGDDDFNPDVIDKAAVLTCRLAWNHPLLDKPSRRCWRSQPTTSTKHGSPRGYVTGSASTDTFGRHCWGSGHSVAMSDVILKSSGSGHTGRFIALGNQDQNPVVVPAPPSISIEVTR